MQKLVVEALNENLPQVTEFTNAFLEACDCSVKTQMLIDLCVEEIFVNIALYAYPGRAGDAEIRLKEENGVVTIDLIDSGVPYDPLKKADPDVTLSADDREVGGLGIFLVKKNMDSVRYRRRNGKNVLTMTKSV